MKYVHVCNNKNTKRYKNVQSNMILNTLAVTTTKIPMDKKEKEVAVEF